MPVKTWGEDPDEERGIWDTLVLGGIRVPGMARVKMKLPTGIEERKARGKRGAGLKDVGSKPRKLDIEVRIYSREDRQLADGLRDLIVGKANGDPMDPLAIIHEGANYFKVNAVVLGDVDIDHPDPIDGWTWNIEAFEWQPEQAIKNVKDQKKKPKDDTSAWLAFRDDGVAGSSAPPSTAGAAAGNLPNPRAP
jgi:hypothetical protein